MIHCMMCLEQPTGVNWTDVTGIFRHNPSGIYGISIINSTVAYACGSITAGKHY
jgi:hypothetical protein